MVEITIRVTPREVMELCLVTSWDVEKAKDALASIMQRVIDDESR